MLKQIKIEEAIGKKFVGFTTSSYDEMAILVFEDGTFTWIFSRSGYDGDTNIKFDSFNDADIWEFGNDQLIDVGVITKQDVLDRAQRIESERKRAKEMAISQKEKNDAAEYLRLKAKFEGGE